VKNGDARLQVPDFIEPTDFLPVELKRPPCLHRYDPFSPKLSRRLTLFSWNAVLLWTMIERHPAIKTFCKRPGFVHVHGDWRIASPQIPYRTGRLASQRNNARSRRECTWNLSF
jgi:hypothetical protein